MDKIKIAERIGFALIVFGLILMLVTDLGYFESMNGVHEYLSPIGLIIWALAYNQREQKEKKRDA